MENVELSDSENQSPKNDPARFIKKSPGYYPDAFIYA